MAEDTTLARPYARAAFEVARDKGQLQQWMSVIAAAAAATKHGKVKAVLNSPTLTADQKSGVITDLLGGSATAEQKKLFALLADYDRLMLLPEISNLFSAMKSEHERTIDVDITSAYPVDNATQRKLVQVLTQKLNREVKLTTKVDQNLLGGAVIRAGDTVIDGSVKGRLSKLAEALNA